MLGESCRQAQAWRTAYPRRQPIMVCVNLSARQFSQPDLVDSIAGVLRETGLDPRLLDLEVTESVAMEDASATIGVLQALRQLGIGLSIDDFGLGHSSLSYLKLFAVHYLKIDSSFITTLGEDARDTVIVSAMIALAHALDLKVTAEGVETGAHLTHLRGFGCDLGQGHLFAPALTPEAVEEMVAAGFVYDLDRLSGQDTPIVSPVPRVQAPPVLPLLLPARPTVAEALASRRAGE